MMNNNNNNLTIKPIITYCNCELEKSRIITENKNKAVIYR